MVPSTKALLSSAEKRPERSEIQSFAASSAVQIVSPTMTSIPPPPTWNSVLSFSKYAP